MEYIIGLFLVTAGLIFGYYLWYRDPRGDEELRRKLSRENEDLRTSLKLAHNSHLKLDERFNRQQGQLLVLQQLCDDWSQGREQAERDRAELEAAAAVANEKVVSLDQQLKEERSCRRDLEDQRHEVAQQHRQQISELEESERQKVQQLEHRLSQQEDQLRSALEAQERLTDQLHESQRETASTRSELESQRKLLDAAKANASGLEQEYVSLETALAENTEELKSSKAECAAALSAQSVAEQSLQALQQQHQSLREDLEASQTRLGELESTEQQAQGLKEALESSRRELERVAQQRDDALQAESEAQQDIYGLKKRLENQEATIHRMRNQHDETREQLRCKLENLSEVEGTLEEVRSKLEAYIKENESVVEKHTSVVSQLIAQRDQIADELDETRTELAELVASHTDAIRQLTSQRDQFADQAKAVEAEMVELMDNHQNRIDSLVEEGNRAREEYDLVCDRSETLAKQVEQLTGICQELETSLNEERENTVEIQASHSRMMIQLEDKSRVTELLQRERDELIQQQLNQTLVITDSQSTELVQEDRFQLTSQIETLSEQRDALLNELAASRDKTIGLEQDASEAQATIVSLQDQVVELETKCQRISELETLVSQQDNSEGHTVQELRILRQQYADAYDQEQQLRQRLQRQEADQQERAAELEQAKVEATSLRAKLKASEETIRNLRRERAAVLARLANYRTVTEPDATVISFTEAMAIQRQSELEYDDEYGGPIREHATRGIIYTETPKQCDDLKRISGIAEVLEARLNDYGIYTFKQIKEWGPEAVEEFSHLLTFKDRITRDDWIGQARQFYEQKLNSHRSYAA